MTPRNIYVVDDHPLIRKALCDAINAEADLHVCGEAASCRETLDDLDAQATDMLVLDLNLTDGNGWGLLQQLRTEGKLPPTLILSVCDEEIYAQRLLQDGASGYLMKNEPIANVLTAIRKILAGNLAFSDAMISRMLQPGTAPSDLSLEHLSDRELQVYTMLGQEMSSKGIAENLGISAKSVSTYKNRLMEKLGLRTTHDLMDHARRKQLGDPS